LLHRLRKELPNYVNRPVAARAWVGVTVQCQADMITGVHAVTFTADAERDRAFTRAIRAETLFADAPLSAAARNYIRQ